MLIGSQYCGVGRRRSRSDCSNGAKRGKARENAESEALDVILSEAVEKHGLESVYEIDTTERDPAGVADELAAVAGGNREPSAGEVDYMGYLT